MMNTVSQTLYDKLWDRHVVESMDNDNALIYIDRHLIHEVTSPQAFEGLQLANRSPWRTNAILAVPDHNVPTRDHQAGAQGILEKVSRLQVETLDKNTQKYKIRQIPLTDLRQGIVHIIGPEQGFTLPGMTLVCGDSHTSTHGALGCLAMGIGTSEVEHVLATQCLIQKKLKNMLIEITGQLVPGVYAKDVILAIIGEIGTAGGTGYAIEFAGSVIRDMSIEGRMTICNMAIEAGSRAGMVAVDDQTIEYVKSKPAAPKGDLWLQAEKDWRTLHSDLEATFDKVVTIDGSKIKPQVSWGTSPEMVVSVDGRIPSPQQAQSTGKTQSIEQALAYMDLSGNMPVVDIPIDYVFIGSCTNARIEDLRAAAKYVTNKKIAPSIERAIVVPGSGLVRQQAEQEGLDKLFINAGFEWREAGCSMCLGMNEDQLPEGKHCASTSNRNFEGRQGRGGRTHLVSPAMAAAAAVNGHFTDTRHL